MAKLISPCPRCGQSNEVMNTVYLRGDKGASVTCKECAYRYRAILSDTDERNLYQKAPFPSAVTPIIRGNEDYVLKSESYPPQ